MGDGTTRSGCGGSGTWCRRTSEAGKGVRVVVSTRVPTNDEDGGLDWKGGRRVRSTGSAERG